MSAVATMDRLTRSSSRGRPDSQVTPSGLGRVSNDFVSQRGFLLKTCTVSDCPRPIHSHGLCHMHRRRLTRTGTLLGKSAPAGIRFEKFFQRGDGCWEWTGATTYGYGKFKADNGARTLAHRFSYALYVGPIPQGMFVCHHCDNPPCVRPDHLWLGTALDNTRDMFAKGRARPATGQKNGAHTHPESIRRGYAHSQAKLTPEDVADIRIRLAAGETQDKIGAAHGVHRNTIYRIKKGQTYTTAPPELNTSLTVKADRGGRW